MPKNQQGVALIIFILGLSAACAAIIGGSFYIKSYYQSPPPSLAPTPQPQVNQIKVPTPPPNKLPPGLDQSYVLDQNIFSFKLFNELSKTEPANNIFFSPASISLALSMVYQGALDQTKETMATTLNITDLSKDDLNKNSQDLLNILKSTDSKVEVSVANSIWVKKGLKLSDDFTTTNQKYYLAQVNNVEFANPNTASLINKWVKENTRSKISKIVSSPLPADAVMYLINAIYFKGIWQNEFDKKLTKDQDFILPSKLKKKYPLMEQKGNFKYLDSDDFQAVSLLYGEEGRFSMDLFLPKKGLKPFTALLNNENFVDWINKMEEKEGTIILPKFRIEYEKELKGPLSNLGMKIAFSNKANFDNLAPQAYLSSVKHKTYLEVDEQGTQAAAVTSVEVGTTSVGGENKTFYMKVDHPFFFVIRDNRLETILFMGIIQDPKAN